MTKVKIKDTHKVNIKWDVLPIDYTEDAEKTIIAKFSNKYGIPKENISVEPRLISIDDNGEVSEYDNETSSNIQNPIFQKDLFKQYIKIKSIEDCDIDKIFEIDDVINGLIDYDAYDKHKKYSIQWIRWSNFMSYGEDNYFDFSKINGLTLLTSDPANQGGKTTFCLDILRFLLYGKVTSREDNWVLSKAFNRHLPEATEAYVEGCIRIDGEDFVIKRTLTRPDLKKRTDKSKVTQKVNYYRLINNEYCDLPDENEESVSTTQTNKLIKDAIGRENDFDLMICVDSDNLKGLIDLKDTDRGRLISRWIGLLPLEEKDKLAREFYNKNVAPTLLTSRYNKEELLNENKSLENENKELEEKSVEYTKGIDTNTKDIETQNEVKENLFKARIQIDESLLKVDVVSLTNQKEMIIESGRRKREEKKENEKKLEEVKNIEFNESDYRLSQEKRIEYEKQIESLRVQARMIMGEIDTLKKSEYCPTCGAKLKNVDNTEKIKEKESEYNKIIEDGKMCSKLLEELKNTLSTLEKKREEYNNKIRLQLIVEKNEVDIENYISKYREIERVLKSVEENKSAIEKNNKIDASINVSNELIKTYNNNIRALNTSLNDVKNAIAFNKKQIEKNTAIISTLEKECKLIRNWKVYLEMVGKNGISKLVLKNTLPIINGELKHMLNDICDFYVEVNIDDRNDVVFNMVHDGVISNLASGSGFEQTVASLALRSVLSKISTFSKPSFVVFDEILGCVSDENYDSLKKLYNKLAQCYETVLHITHNKTISDWHNSTIVIKKKNNISYIENY